jgi:hypothetical protein
MINLIQNCTISLRIVVQKFNNYIEFQQIVFLCFSPLNSLITEDK